MRATYRGCMPFGCKGRSYNRARVPFGCKARSYGAINSINATTVDSTPAVTAGSGNILNSGE